MCSLLFWDERNKSNSCHKLTRFWTNGMITWLEIYQDWIQSRLEIVMVLVSKDSSFNQLLCYKEGWMNTLPVAKISPAIALWLWYVVTKFLMNVKGTEDNIWWCSVIQWGEVPQSWCSFGLFSISPKNYQSSLCHLPVEARKSAVTRDASMT